jgi:hypothetical protein
MKVGSKEVVDKFLGLFVFSTPSLVLEYDIVVPPPLHIEILGV